LPRHTQNEIIRNASWRDMSVLLIMMLEHNVMIFL